MANSASPEQNQNHCSVINNSIPLMQGNLPTLTLSGKIRVTVTFFLFLLSATFNASFLLKLQKWTQKKENGKKLSRMKLLLKHLTLANLLETLIVMPLDGMWNITVQWYAGEFLCKVLSYLKLFSMYAPAFMMVVISLDRSLAITRPLALKSSSKLGQSMVGLAWILSSVFAGPQVGINYQCPTAVLVKTAKTNAVVCSWSNTAVIAEAWACLDHKLVMPRVPLFILYKGEEMKEGEYSEAWMA
ncbi:hypothetical protein H8959_019641 [Pygathrix nigripes]